MKSDLGEKHGLIRFLPAVMDKCGEVRELGEGWSGQQTSYTNSPGGAAARLCKLIAETPFLFQLDGTST